MLPYGLVAIPLLFVLYAPFPVLTLAFGLLVFAQLWNFWIQSESFKEAYGLDSAKVLVVIIAPVIVLCVLAVSTGLVLQVI